jgi:phage terminase large subunit
LRTSALYQWNSESVSPVVVNQGGTSSGKTYSILQLLFTKAVKEENIVITVVGQDIPNLKVGALRDAENIWKETPAFEQEVLSYNKSDRTFHFKNGSLIEFKSYDGAQDAKSGKRDYLFINEANGVPYPVYVELALRTRKQVFLDYNPNEEFWVHEKLIGADGVQLIISDHRHNPFLSQAIRDKIEALKDQDIELWKVYARGMTGKIEGLILRNYSVVEGIPHGATLIANGMDFGFTNDVTSFGQVYKMDGELWIDELIYETNLTNPDIADKLRGLSISRQEEIIADSSEPKSIQELRNEGFNVIPALKGPDSIRLSLNILRRYKLNITRRSYGLRKEVKTYKWKTTKDGKSLNEPVDFSNHTIDWLRYVAILKLGHNTASGNYSFA